MKSTSMGDAGSMPQEHPHGRSTGPAMFYVGDTQTGSQTFPEGESAPKRAGVAMSREEVHARYDGGRHPESFRRHVLASPANGGCSDADIGEGRRNAAQVFTESLVSPHLKLFCYEETAGQAEQSTDDRPSWHCEPRASRPMHWYVLDSYAQTNMTTVVVQHFSPAIVAGHTLF